MLFSCGDSKSSSVVSKYLKVELASDYETAYSLLSSVDRSVKSLAEYKEQESSEFELFFTEAVRKSTTFQLCSTNQKSPPCELSCVRQWRGSRRLLRKQWSALGTEPRNCRPRLRGNAQKNQGLSFFYKFFFIPSGEFCASV